MSYSQSLTYFLNLFYKFCFVSGSNNEIVMVGQYHDNPDSKIIEIVLFHNDCDYVKSLALNHTEILK